MATSLGLLTLNCPGRPQSYVCTAAPQHHPFASSLASSFLCSSRRFTPVSSERGDGTRKHHAGLVVMEADSTAGRPPGKRTQVVEDKRKFREPPNASPSAGSMVNSPQCTMADLKIPCLFMRGGTSRGPYFLWQHLPKDRADIDKVLLRAMGTPEEPELTNKKNTQVNGVGGATSVTSKVAILEASSEPGIDVDYTFAQVAVGKSLVDWGPSCGNMLAGVGPAAIEMGLIRNVSSPTTRVTIRAVNNGALVEAIIQTPEKRVVYEGDASIDGVPGLGAPVMLNFMNLVGSKTGKLLPTGNVIDVINGIEVTCIDVAMPIVVATAKSLGKTGYESKIELDEDDEFFERIEAIRRVAGEKMGFGDVSNRVVPKFAIVAPPLDKVDSNITARYFVPDSTHGAMAVTGAICMACCSILRGSIADPVSVKTRIGGTKNRVVIEHPSGKIQLILDYEQDNVNPGMKVNSAGVVRTCRLLFEGFIRVPQRRLRVDDVQQEPSRIGSYIRFYEQLQKHFRRLYNFKMPKKGIEKVKMAEKGNEKEDQLATWDDEDPSVERSTAAMTAEIQSR